MYFNVAYSPSFPAGNFLPQMTCFVSSSEIWRIYHSSVKCTAWRGMSQSRRWLLRHSKCSETGVHTRRTKFWQITEAFSTSSSMIWMRRNSFLLGYVPVTSHQWCMCSASINIRVIVLSSSMCRQITCPDKSDSSACLIVLTTHTYLTKVMSCIE